MIWVEEWKRERPLPNPASSSPTSARLLAHRPDEALATDAHQQGEAAKLLPEAPQAPKQRQIVLKVLGKPNAGVGNQVPSQHPLRLGGRDPFLHLARHVPHGIG